jgi:hypothetical protein
MDSYVKYVNNQQLMLDKYFPWLTDYQIMWQKIGINILYDDTNIKNFRILNWCVYCV